MIKIETLSPKHSKGIEKNIKDKEVVKWTLNIPHPYPQNGAIDFIKKAHRAKKARKEFHFAIIHDGNTIGGIGFTKIDWKSKHAELGYWLGKKYWGKGYMTKAVKEMLEFGFTNLKLHRICAEVYEPNKASQRVLNKNGFKLEGKLKEAAYRNKRFYDQLIFGKLNNKEYKSRQNR